MVSTSSNSLQSVLEAPTVRVLDSFTSGGQQLAGSRRSTTATVASDLDYVRGKHSIRTGVQFDALRLRSNEASK